MFYSILVNKNREKSIKSDYKLRVATDVFYFLIHVFIMFDNHLWGWTSLYFLE